MCKFVTTLKTLRKNGACYGGYNKLVRSLQGEPFSQEDSFRGSYIRFRHEEEIPILYILESNGLDDAFWALRCVANVDKDSRLFAVWCVRQVEHLLNDASIKCLNVAEKYANGEATLEEMGKARNAARNAARGAAWYAASCAARDAASCAARNAARGAAWYAASWAARDADIKSQEEMFIQMCTWQTKE